MSFPQEKRVQRRFGITVILSTWLLLGVGEPGLAQSRSPQPERPTNTQNQNRIRLNLPDLRAPGNLEGAAVRGGCKLPAGEQLRGLLPPSAIGLTTAAHPTLMLYVPPALEETVNGDIPTHFFQLEVTLRDLAGKTVSATFPLPPQSGIVSLPLPEDQTLALDQPYQWIVKAFCSPADLEKIFHPPSGMGIGWIQRIAPDAALTTQLAQAAPEAIPQHYAAAGIWYDAVSQLASLYAKQPNLAGDWRGLLEAVDLDAIADQPLLDCCTAKGATSRPPATTEGNTPETLSPSRLPGRRVTNSR